MPDRFDLGPCTAIRHDGDPARCAIVLPGVFYPTRAPVLWFAREAVMAEGWSALEVLGEPGTHPEPLDWVRRCAERALESADAEHVLVIGKSLSSRLAGMVAGLGLPAVWLTPLLHEAVVLDGLAGARRPTLVLGGTADSVWRPEGLPNNPALSVVEIAAADHALQVEADLSASLDALRRVAESAGALAARA